MRHPRTAGATSGAAVADVVGSILLVAITVVAATLMGALIFAFKGPVSAPYANLAVSVSPGQGGWGTGDEQIVVTDLGGTPLAASSTTISYSINGGATTSVTGGALGFAGGSLHIGQAWTQTLTLQSTDTVVAKVVTTGNLAHLLATATLVPGQVSAGTNCPFDVSPPTATYTQTPSAVTVATQTGATVVAALTDNCAGVNSAVVPHLFSRLTPAQSTYTDQGAMTSLGGNQWSGTVPAPASAPTYWALQFGQTLQYYVSPVTDLKGNTGQAATQSSVVQLSGGTQTYVTSHTEIAPTTITNPATLTAADGVFASINEGAGSAPATLSANSVASSGTGWSGGSNTFVQDGTYATNANNAPGTLKLGFPSATAAGTILSVKFNLRQDISPAAIDDTWSVHACLNGGACGTTAIAAQPGTTADTTLTFDVTGDRPGGGSWTWADINNLQANIQPNKVGSRDGTWRLDYVSATISSTAYTGTEQLDWTGVPAGTAGTHYLDLSYSGASTENWNVNVWNWVTSTYTQRGTLTAATATQFAYALGANEYQVGTGNVRIQLTDAAPPFSGPNSLGVDYARVDTL